MALRITREEVWVADLQDQPGGLAQVLESLAAAGADLDCVIARRRPERPGSGVVYLTPVKARAQDAARHAGLSPAGMIATLRVEGPNQAGLGAQMLRAIAEAPVNIRGVSTAVLGDRFVTYIGLDTSEAADRATAALKGIKLASPPRKTAKKGGKSAKKARKSSKKSAKRRKR
jgi:hypothetical protein